MIVFILDIHHDIDLYIYKMTDFSCILYFHNGNFGTSGSGITDKGILHPQGSLKA